MANIQALGELINWVDVRNKGVISDNLLGINIDKFFMPSVANIIGTDLSSYKLIRNKQFACNPMHVGRDEKMPIALYMDDSPSIVSPAYFVFEVKDAAKINPEYLMLWFRRAEFDRECWYHTDGSVRGGITWDEILEMTVPVPSIEEQNELVKSYRDIERRIQIKKDINDNLESQANTIFRKYIADTTTKSSIYDILSVVNGAAFSSEYFNTDKIGLPLVRIRDLKSCVPEVWTNEILTKAEYIRSGDILIGMDGEFVPYIWYGAKSLLNQRVCKVIPKQGIHPFFLYATLKPILADIERTQGGTTVIHLGKKDFDKMVCFNIDNEKHYDFFYIIEPIYSLIIANNQEILSLSEAKKSILSYLSR